MVGWASSARAARGGERRHRHARRAALAITGALLCAAPVFGADSAGRWIGVPPPGGRVAPNVLHDAIEHRLLMFGGTNGAACNDLWSLNLDESRWSHVEPSGAPPPPRHGHSTAYDTQRDRWIVFGGTNASGFVPDPTRFNDVWALSRDDGLTWTELAPSGTPPSSRAGHVSAYDGARDRVLVFGGNDGVRRNDVWALDLSGIPAWSQLAPSGDPPAPRENHVAMLDPTRDRMVVFGGNTGALDGEVWALELSGSPAWTQLSPAGASAPSARYGASAIHDPPRDRWLVFGGFDGALKNDVWSLSLPGSTSWTEIVPAGDPPTPRVSHRAVYDPASDRMLLLGGGGATFELPSDVWALSLAEPTAWDRILADAAPPGRLAHTAIYDPTRERMVMFAGQSGSAMNDVWTLSLGESPTWTALETSGTPPPPRSDHAAVHDAARDRMLVFGGSFTSETWELTLGEPPTWGPLATSGGPPAARVSHTAILDPMRDRLIVFGGSTETQLLDDVWALSLSTLEWSELEPAGARPVARRDHVAILDPVRDRMIVYGGNANMAPFLNDVWALSLADPPGWTELSPSGPSPEGPITHAALYDPVRDRLVSFGGSYHHETWELSLDPEPAWHQLMPAGLPPTGRVDHSVVYDPARDRMIVFSGHSGLTILGDTWILEWGGNVSAGHDPGRPAPPPIASFPNPARGAATIRFFLPEAGAVSLMVYDARGRLVETLVDGDMAPGVHAVRWDLTAGGRKRVPPGVYFYELDARGVRNTRRQQIVR